MLFVNLRAEDTTYFVKIDFGFSLSNAVLFNEPFSNSTYCKGINFIVYISDRPDVIFQTGLESIMCDVSGDGFYYQNDTITIRSYYRFRYIGLFFPIYLGYRLKLSESNYYITGKIGTGILMHSNYDYYLRYYSDNSEYVRKGNIENRDFYRRFFTLPYEIPIKYSLGVELKKGKINYLLSVFYMRYSDIFRQSIFSISKTTKISGVTLGLRF